VAVGALRTEGSVPNQPSLAVAGRGVTIQALGVVVRAVQGVSRGRVIEFGDRERVGRVARQAVASLELTCVGILRSVTPGARPRRLLVIERDLVERVGAVTGLARDVRVDSAVGVVFRVTALAALGGHGEREARVSSISIEVARVTRCGRVRTRQQECRPLVTLQPEARGIPLRLRVTVRTADPALHRAGEHVAIHVTRGTAVGDRQRIRSVRRAGPEGHANEVTARRAACAVTRRALRVCVGPSQDECRPRVVERILDVRPA